MKKVKKVVHVVEVAVTVEGAATEKSMVGLVKACLSDFTGTELTVRRKPVKVVKVVVRKNVRVE